MPKPKAFIADTQKVFEARHNPLETPIDLCVADAVPLLLPDLEWMYLNRVPSKLKIANTGRTMILNPTWCGGGPRVRGGPLKSEYLLAQVHFHWGKTDNEGSEHSVEGQRLPLEMHVVSYNASYESHQRALQEPDGTAIVAFFFVLQDQDNPLLSELLPALERVCDEGTTIRYPPFAISRLLPAVRSDYLIYWGTVSSRNLLHQLLWLIDRKPIGISHQQMSMFRAVRQTQDYARRTDPAPDPRQGALFYADPTRRPLDVPTLLPLDSNATTQREAPWTQQPRIPTPMPSPRGSLLSNRLTKSMETGMERRLSQPEDRDVYKTIDSDQEKPFSDSSTVPVAFSFNCRRGIHDDPRESLPYLPARNVSFNQSNQVQFPNRREAVETGRTGYTSSDSSESESAHTRYYTARTSMRRRPPLPGKRKREQSSSRAATHSIGSTSSSLSRNHFENADQKSNTSSNRPSRGGIVNVPWSDESLSPSIELGSSDLTDPMRTHASRTRPSIINTCGIEDLIIETLPQTSAPKAKPSRITRQHPDAAAIVSSRFCGVSALPKDHPNAQPLLAKSMTGASVAGSFVQEELTRSRDQEQDKGSKGL